MVEMTYLRRPEHRILEDRTSLKALVDLMPPLERKEFESYAALELESAFEGRRFIVFDLEGGAPTKIDTLTFGDFTIPKGRAPNCPATFQAAAGGAQDMTLSVIPIKLPDREVFLSIPQKFEFRWGGREFNGKVSFQPHFAVLIKTRHKHHHKLDGFTYCLSQKRFMQEYPLHAQEARM